MKLHGLGKIIVVVGTLTGICGSRALLAAGAADPAPRVIDVSLRDGGVLAGQVLDPQGIAKAGTPVSLNADQKQLAVSKTDQNGTFAFGGVRGGVYQLVTAEGHGIYRAWAPGTAPPSAKSSVLLVSGANTVRGQSTGAASRFFSNPIVIGGLAATAVAVPVAVVASEQHPASP